MADLLFTISSDVLPANAHVVSIKGKEGLSEIYRFEIGLLINDPAFELESAIRGRASLTINSGDGEPPYQFHGMFASVELLHEWDNKTLYRAILVPQFWQLLLTNHSRVFTGDPILEIIDTILTSSELTASDFSIHVQQSYDPKEFVAQYKESNYHFIARWMEREGLYYYFEQGADREKLVIVDAKGLHEPQPGQSVRYVPGTGNTDTMSLQSLAQFRCKGSALPATVEMLDYDYLNPALEVKGSANVVEGFGEISIWDDNFMTSADGNRYASVRAEELLARRKVFTGTGRVFNLRPGYTFTLDEHPRDSFNSQYLTVELSHYGNQSASDPVIMELLGLDSTDEYRVELVAIPADVQYRSPDRVRWPRIEGYESALVCGGANSKYAQIDPHGRYKVRVLFDESDLDDGDASAWVRMQQPYGGGNEGFHFPLVKGTEVLLFFSGGDPDQPVIAGVAPNAHKPSPVINENHTLNIITTINNNLIEIEDNSGHQYIYIYTPTENTYIHMGDLKNEFNFIINTEGHAHFHIGGDQVIDVDLTLTETVELDVTFNYNLNWMVNVIADTTIEIGANFNIHVVGEVHYNFDAIWNVTVLDNTNIDISGNLDIHVKGPVVEIYDVDVDVDIGGNYTVNVKGDTNLTVTNNYNVNVDVDYIQVVQANFTQNILCNYTHVVNNTYSITVAGPTEEKFWDFHIKINGGATSDTFIGFKNENFIGGKLGISIGVLIELAAALKLEAHAGATIKLDAAAEFKLGGPVIEAKAAKIKAYAAAQVTAAATKLGLQGILIEM